MFFVDMVSIFVNTLCQYMYMIIYNIFIICLFIIYIKCLVATSITTTDIENCFQEFAICRSENGGLGSPDPSATIHDFQRSAKSLHTQPRQCRWCGDGSVSPWRGHASHTEVYNNWTSLRLYEGYEIRWTCNRGESSRNWNWIGL